MKIYRMFKSIISPNFIYEGRRARVANLCDSILFLSSRLVIGDVHALARYTIAAVTSGTTEIGKPRCKLAKVYLSKYLHFLRGTHIHFQLAVATRILCAKLASVDARMYRCVSRTWFSTVSVDCHTRLHRLLTKSRFDATRQPELRCNRKIP